MVACPDEMKLRLALKAGEPIPDICKPGAWIEKMKPEDREILKGLTSDMASNFRL